MCGCWEMEPCLCVYQDLWQAGWYWYIRRRLGQELFAGPSPVLPTMCCQSRSFDCFSLAVSLAYNTGTWHKLQRCRAIKKAGIKLVDRQLACMPIGSPEGQDYLKAMAAAANFAFCNRQDAVVE